MVIEKLKLEDIEGLLELYKELIPFENSLKKSIEIYKEILQDEQYLIVVAKEKNCDYAILVSSDYRKGAHLFYVINPQH